MGLDSIGDDSDMSDIFHLVHLSPGAGDVMVSWAAKVFCVMILAGAALSDPAYPDDDITPVVTGIEHPLPTPTEVLPKAATAIADAWGALDHMLFLSDDYWPTPMNNSSTNLTA